LRGVREERGLSGKDLAERTSISASYISEIETGKRPLTESFAERISAAMSMSFDDLIRQLRGRYIAPATSRKLPGFENLQKSQLSIAAGGPVAVEESTPGYPTSDYRELCVSLVQTMSKPDAWELVRKFTVQAEAGDATAARCAKALINILSEIP